MVNCFSKYWNYGQEFAQRKCVRLMNTMFHSFILYQLISALCFYSFPPRLLLTCAVLSISQHSFRAFQTHRVLSRQIHTSYSGEAAITLARFHLLITTNIFTWSFVVRAIAYHSCIKRNNIMMSVTVSWMYIEGNGYLICSHCKSFEWFFKKSKSYTLL